MLTNKSYVVLKHIFSQEECRLLSDYARFKAALKFNTQYHDPLAGVHREYGDVMMESLLERLTPTIEKAIGLQLWPTLSFYYLYKKGDVLAKHQDRSSCEFVAGVCLGGDEPWPLMIDDNGIPTAIALDVGDLVIFKGYTTEHWREAFTGTWFVSAIFAYVDKNGPLSFQKYDQRKRLGKPHVGMLRWCYGCIKNSVIQRIKR